MENGPKSNLLYYLKTPIKNHHPIYVHKEPSIQSEISEILYLGKFIPVYETHNGFFRTNNGWIDETYLKNTQRVIPANITDIGVWIIAEILPRSNQNRTCKHQAPQFIMCEWSNHYSNQTYSTMEWAEWLNQNETAFSYHYTVTSDLILQHIPDYEEAYANPSQHPATSIKNTIFIKICDGDIRHVQAVVESLCRLLQTWYGHLNIIGINCGER